MLSRHCCDLCMFDTSARLQGPVTRSIIDILEELDRGEYMIPQIQREFVWKDELIFDFYDSLMKKYFIGSMIFWVVNKKTIGTLKMSRDIRENLKESESKSEFLENINHDSEISDTNSEYRKTNIQGKYLVFDGQQRLTALYSGLVKEKYEKSTKGILYIDLLSGYQDWKEYQKEYEASGREIEIVSRYDFRFGEPGRKKDGQYWVPFNIFLGSATDLEKIKDKAKKDVRNLGQGIIKKDIRYILGAEQSIQRKVIEEYTPKIKDKRIDIIIETIDEGRRILDHKIETYHVVSGSIIGAIELFGKINNSGKRVSGSELLLCFFWGLNEDMRNNCSEFVKKIKGDYDFDSAEELQDILMRLSFYVCDESIDFDSKALGQKKIRDNLDKIAEKWEKITRIFKNVIELFDSYGLLFPIGKHNVMLVIAYYLYRCNYDEESFLELMSNRKVGGNWRKIKNWVALSIFKGTFSTSSNSILNQARRVIRRENNEGEINLFPARQLVEKFDQEISKEELHDMLHTSLKNRSNKIHALFSLMLSEKTAKSGKQEIDHIFPKSNSSGIEDDFRNYQLLSGDDNRKKSARHPGEWLSDLVKKQINTQMELKTFLEDKYIHTSDINEQANLDKLIYIVFENPEEFIKKREEYLGKIIVERCGEIGALKSSEFETVIAQIN